MKMKEKQAMKWEKIRAKGKRRYYILFITNMTLAGTISRVLFNWLNHKPYFYSYPLIFTFTFVGFTVGIRDWNMKEKQYLEYIQKKSQLKQESE